MQVPTVIGMPAEGSVLRVSKGRDCREGPVSRVHPYQYGVTLLGSCPVTRKEAARVSCAAPAGTLIGKLRGLRGGM